MSKINRRKFLHMSAASVAGLVISSCAPATSAPVAATAQVVEKQVEVTRVVEVAGTPVVEVVTATPEPTKAPAAVADVLGAFPRRETFIARQLTGRVGTPDNFNQWVGWKWQDRGIQNLADEPLWSVDFATGKIINGSCGRRPEVYRGFHEPYGPAAQGRRLV